MKKLLMAVCAVSMFCFSCSKDETPAVFKQKSLPGRIIYSGWDLYEEHADGKMYAAYEAEEGDEVSVLLNGDDSIDQKTAVRHLQSGKEENLNFVHVLYENREYWTRDIFVTGPDVMSVWVAIRDTFVYSAPNGGSLTEKVIKEGTVLPGPVQAEGNDGFYKVVIYNGKPFGREVWVKGDDLGGKDQFMEIARVFSKINEKTPADIRDEVVERLVNDTHFDLIQAEAVYLHNKITEAGKKGLISADLYEKLKTAYMDEF